MTVIAWDGITLAADKLIDTHGFSAIGTKIHRAPNGSLVGSAGDSDTAQSMQRWYFEGAKPELFPAKAAAPEPWGRMLVITVHRVIELYCSTAYPIIIESDAFAIGSGADFALAAMQLGKGAVDAVALACVLSVHCGAGIDTLKLPDRN